MSDATIHDAAQRAADARRGATQTVIYVLAVVALMGSLAFAAVPLYQLFCQVTGFGGTPLRSDAAPAIVADSEAPMVTVRFDANVSSGMSWDFAPVETEMTVRVGEPQIMYYRAHNPTAKPVGGTATFNVTPLQIGGYFVKMECFCFQEQVLQPGETVEMPVKFYVDAALLDDPAMKDVSTITLSYTFFRRDDLASLE